MYDHCVYLLDLCIYAYQLHAQTLIWPMDPYYEQWRESKGSEGERGKRRYDFMDQVRECIRTGTLGRIDKWRGPGVCTGPNWPHNDLLDPVISDYSRLNPWLPSFSRPDMESDGWIVYNAPKPIKGRIKFLKVVRYKHYVAKQDPLQEQLVLYQTAPSYIQGATDLLYCFEGGTGAVGLEGDANPPHAGRPYASWGILGFVLARTITDVEMGSLSADPNNPQEVAYDIYVVFRGSRSGQLRFGKAESAKRGNPDWVTDLEYLEFIEDKDINVAGRCSRGFRTSLKQTLPNIVLCLQEIHAVKKKAPRSIYVTGHSLGGALAAHFLSAMVLGQKYGPHGGGVNMPNELRAWPWDAAGVTTFGAPLVGNEAFQEAFDAAAHGRRFWVHGDVVTLKLRGFMGELVGEGAHLRSETRLTMGQAHDPVFIRRCLITYRRNATHSDMTDTPAGTVGTEAEEPWKVFPSCQAAFEHIVQRMKSEYGLSQSAPSVTDILPEFDVLLAQYAQVVEAALPGWYDFASGRGAFTPHANQVQSTLNALTTYLQTRQGGGGSAALILDLASVWKHFRDYDILPDWWKSKKGAEDSRFSRFIGLCLFLSGLRRLPQLLTDIKTMGGPEAKAFRDLIGSKF